MIEVDKTCTEAYGKEREERYAKHGEDALREDVACALRVWLGDEAEDSAHGEEMLDRVMRAVSGR